MKILTIDTTGNLIHLILQEADGIVDDLETGVGGGHAELLLPTVEEILTRNKLFYDSIECLSILNGPGSFVGLRVSMAFMKALRCAQPRIKIILNSIFQVLSFQLPHDFVVLEAGASGLYISDKEQHSFYVRKEDGCKFLSRDSRIITNSPYAIDFLKSPNIIVRQVDSRGMVALNHFKCTEEQFGKGKMEPIYIREPQINTKNE
ncbi:MAG: hypothetical protein LBI29_04675 [Rickettsiales bacterium]|jgi:tRNA A37 threonylcarbamoyladenosine modification protein TsaB|nr:hypothetical protein [Rickettsiales bacterium]